MSEGDLARSGGGLLERLLEVQAHDTLGDQLAHRRQALPGLARIAAIDRRLRDLTAELNDIAGRRDEVAGRQQSAERELASMETKLKGLEQKLYSGSVTVPRELQAMESEREAFRRRIESLEDDVLSAMTEREPLDTAIATMTAEAGTLEGERRGLAADVAAEQGDIDSEIAGNTAARAAAVEGLPADLLALYERLRPRLGGVAIAPLANGRCGGCHLDLAPSEIDAIRRQPPDTIVYCEQCGRILVRPA